MEPETIKPGRREMSELQAKTVKFIAAVMALVGAAGATGTFMNMRGVFGGGTAVGVVAAAEGATLVLALTTIALTIIEQPTPWILHLGMVGIPTAAAIAGFEAAGADTAKAIVFALTQLAMVAAAEGGALVARKVIVYTTGVDPNAQKRNADIAQRLNFHAARAQKHPSNTVQRRSLREMWRLAKYAGVGDNALAEDLVQAQRARIAQGTDEALRGMFSSSGEAAPGPTVGTASAKPALAPATPFVKVPDQVFLSSEQNDEGDSPKPSGRPVAVGDEELYDAGFDMIQRMGPPRSAYRFRKVMRAAGHSGSDSRLNAIYERVMHEINDASIDAITANEKQSEGRTFE
jgi:hypothetical protein